MDSGSGFDLAVIGGGPGGYVAAIRAAQLGLRCVLIEREHLGGICLNWGCIPTKALLRAGEINHLLHNLGPFGFAVDNPRYDFAAVIARSRSVAGQLSAGVSHLLRKNKVQVVMGAGRLAGPGRIAVQGQGGEQIITARHIILATGARARTLAGLQPDGKFIWTYKEAMLPAAMPRQVAVVGSGAIGIEFASFYRAMGAEVTVLEVMDRILPAEDEEISAFAQRSFEAQGMRIITGAVLGPAEIGKAGVRLPVTAGGRQDFISAERVISAVGIIGNTEGLGLEGTGVVVERGHVVVDGLCRTGEAQVYAIGDLAGPPWLAHKASHEGVLCVEAIAGHPVQPLDVRNVPGCTYCRPQIASVGYTEAAARAAGRAVKIGKFPFIGNGKAIAAGESEGMVKTVFDAQTGELLGAHMIGAEVTEMIQGFTIARTLESTEAELMHSIFPHPTISETMHEAVLAAYGRALHI